ncbi:hypothetical protein [Labilibaculum manganireducens]|nr:hypothetical protein [Labilibaculum manganireducens]
MEKRYITLMSDYEPMHGKIIKLEKKEERLLITLEIKDVSKEIILQNTIENLVLFESAKVGYMFVCKKSEAQSTVAIYYQNEDGGVRVYPFYLKEEK